VKIDKIVISNFRCFGEPAEVIELENDITCFVGNNGSGKTTLITALKRLFSPFREERIIVKEDFHLKPNETTQQLIGRQLFIDVTFSFPELAVGNGDGAEETCPEFSSVIYADLNDKLLKARIRLEAEWSEGEYEDAVESKIYWVTTSSEVAFGDNCISKFSMSSSDRRLIKLKYIPAFRDSQATLRNEVKSLIEQLENYTLISDIDKEKVESLSVALSNKVKDFDSVKHATKTIEALWNQLHDSTLKHYNNPHLEVTPSEVNQLLRAITIKLSPSESGEAKDISQLSDGQISLLYISLSFAVFDLEQKHNEGKISGFKQIDKEIPAYTIFAFEEPENHLSTYYLGRVISVLSEKCKASNITGIITSHSASVIRRLERVEQIRYFRQAIDLKSRHTQIRSILLPKNKSEEDYKYINQAILAHPELYFAKLVILGEGSSEEIILPKLASKLNFDLDPSFVGFVKLGGRHVNHMWRLLNDLKIPHITLLDFDLGRYQAGPYRIKLIITELKNIGTSCSLPERIEKSLSSSYIKQTTLKALLKILEQKNIFFSYPLDLDMLMLQAFPEFYTAPNAKKSSRESLLVSVLGKESDSSVYEKLSIFYSNSDLMAYRNLFGTKSKVCSHYSAIEEIINMEDEEFEKKCPNYIKRLVNKCQSLLHAGLEDA
jgi:putative ATP-dependent endonuclease of OLD family